jgi:hypothetical protein
MIIEVYYTTSYRTNVNAVGITLDSDSGSLEFHPRLEVAV